VPDLVPKRFATAEEAETLYRARLLTIDGQLVSRAEVDRILREETDLALRRKAWESRQEIGRAEKPLLVRLRWLENEIVRAMGARNVFAYRAREYGLTVPELQLVLEGVLRELRPLQTELHTFLRHELARRFERPVPDAIPAHWLPDATGAANLVAWLGLSDPEAALDAEFADETPRSLVERADGLWTSLGFAPLPESFYAASVFGPNPAGATLLVSHVDRAGDVRAIFDTSSDARGWLEANGLVGRVHCARLTVQSDVPFMLRHGPNRALHAALARAVTLGAVNPRSVRSAGFPGAADAADPIPRLLVMALQTVLPIVHSGGTLFHFEKAVYADAIGADAWNERWWATLAKFEGIAPPAPRDERWFDAGAELGLITNPAQGYDEAFAQVIGFELYDHIARSLLDGDARDVDIHGRKAVGDFVRSIARFGATVDWRTKMREKLGYEISARAIVDYFEPLRVWLVRENEGRRATLPRL
jgi:peptidyl-dipeptidase A